MTRSPSAIGRSHRLRPALDIGGTHVSAALVDLATDPVVVDARSDTSLDANAQADVILDRIAGCASTIDQTTEVVWGVAIPGPFDYAAGIARFHGVAKFESLDGVDLRAALMERIHPTPADLHFLKDADAFGLGEWRAGAASGHERAVAITLGTGVGSAFLAAGSVIDDDPSVPPEGRLDLLAIDGRPLEDTVSRRAILARYATLTEGVRTGLDVRDLAERARAGDFVARRVFDDAMGALGKAICPWLSAFRATALVVGGAIAGSWDIIAKPLGESLANADPALSRRLEILPSRRPFDTALIGAALHSAEDARPFHQGTAR
jgi:glucokinase